MSLFPNNNIHGNDNQDFLNLTLSLKTWSATMPFSDAAPPFTDLSYSDVAPPLPNLSYSDTALPLPDLSYSSSTPSITHQPSNLYTLPIPSPQTTSQSHPQRMGGGGPIRNNRTRRTSIRLKPGKGITIPPPYPWATDRRAILHDLQKIQSKGINTVTGTVKCTDCNQQFDINYDLLTQFKEVQLFVIKNKHTMSQRAPKEWNSPPKLDCQLCNQKNCVKPILDKKRSINWLFLLLGQMIGHCKLAELKYFCKHTRNHKTGAKDRVLYLTYLELFRQLDPLGDYDP